MARKYDVIVVGAGVAGLVSAWVLAKKGFDVALVDSKPRELIGERPCGDAIGSHHFAELGLEPPADVIDHRYKGAKVISPSEEHEITVPGEGVSIRSREFGQWLLNNAVNAGADVLDNHTLLGIKLGDRGVEKAILKERGKPGTKEVRARAFIDAGGAKPAFRLKLPSSWPISERPHITDYNLAYREVIEVEEGVPDEYKDYVVIFMNPDISPGGYWWYFPKEGGTRVNIGLGVIWSTEGYNPRHRFDKYLRGRAKGRVIHRGGGMVPTRRPLPTLVWRNVGVVGDAAYTVNPVHGGGRGSSMLAATIVAKHMGNALEEGEVSEETMWEANIEYMKAYGAKQASLDVLRMYLQKLSRNDLEFVFRKKIVDGRAVLEIGEKGNLVEEVVKNIRPILSLIGRPGLLNRLRIIKKNMDEAKRLYLNEYPRSPRDLNPWMKKVEEFFRRYKETIGFKEGPLVPWR